MSDVPSNLIPTRITQLPTAPVASEDSLMMIVYNGNNYQIRVGDLLSVAGVPTTRQVIAGTSLTGGGQLSSNVTLSVATGGITSTQLSATGVTAGSYGDATNIPVFTVDSTGRVTAASTIAATISGYVPTTRQVIAGTGLTGGGPLNANVTLAANLSDSTPLVGDTTGSAGVATSMSRSDHQHPQVDLSSANEVENILGLSNGGTARSLTPNSGAIIWSGADGLYVGPPGSAGQVLVSGGTAAPTWSSVGSGTVTTVSVVSANGFAGTVADATTTPAITLTTSISGMLKGSASALVAATSGTDFSAGTSALATGILKSTTSTGALTIAVAADFPTLDQNTTGTAAGLSATLAIGSGGTGATTLAGAKIPVWDVANTFTGTQTFSGTSTTLAAILTNAAEVATVSATAATGTIAYYTSSQSVLYYTSNASANWTVNLTHSAGTTLNTAMTTGQAITMAFLVTQGATAFYNSTVQVDGTVTGVTTKWQGGTAPTSGNANSVDVYQYTVIKTGAATFTVLASVTKYA